MKAVNLRRLLLGLLASLALASAALIAPASPAVTSAQAQISAEFQEALSPYGRWERHPRWGEIWIPDDTPPDWRPYQYGHWIYTDEWGWYWISDPEEEDWGWVAYHYGRWARDRRFGWFWIPDDEWAPAWVDWRYGDDIVGWAPLPPDELIEEYDDDPAYWVFVAAPFLIAPRLHAYYLPRHRHGAAFRRSHVVNRTLRYGRNRAAVNPGISPAFVARRSGRALPTYRVSPHVLAGTRGVAGALRVSPQQLRAPRQRGRRPSATRSRAVTVQRTTTAIQPAATSTTPQPLGRNQRGRLGRHPPRAAQGVAPAQPKQLQQQPARPRVMQPPPAKSAAPPQPPHVKPPQMKRTAPAARPTPPAVRRTPPPTVKRAPPPTVKRVAPQRPPQVKRPQAHKPQQRGNQAPAKGDKKKHDKKKGDKKKPHDRGK